VASGVALLAASHGGRAATVVVPYPHEVAQVSFAVAGDVIPHEPVRVAAASAGDGAVGWAALFGDVSDVFERADFGFVNLETPVAPRTRMVPNLSCSTHLSTCSRASRQRNQDRLVCHNHVMDQGWAGFAETREHLREQGIVFVGSGDTAQQAWQPVFVEANGIKVGWLGMTRWLNGGRNSDKDDQPQVNFFPYPNESAGASGMDEAAFLKPSNRPRAVRSAGGLHPLGHRVRSAPRPRTLRRPIKYSKPALL